ncbi:unnamed protein product, partial [Didymodactylos carnosus]
MEIKQRKKDLSKSDDSESLADCYSYRPLKVQKNATASCVADCFSRESTNITSDRYTERHFETENLRQVRQRTFSHWLLQSPSRSQMIEAGFFRCNASDRVICIYCNLICQQWSANDNPLEIHKSLSSNCTYVKSFHELVFDLRSNEQLKMNFNDTSEELKIPSKEVLATLVDARLKLSITQILLEKGFCLSVIKQCYNDQLNLK